MTTTNPFTEAAHRDMDPSVAGKNNRAWFVAGAEWQAAQETDGERAVRELHREVTVYALDSMNGTWVYRDDERVVLRRFCAECSSEDAIHAVEDQDWMEDWGYAWEVDYPCATIQALDAARRDEDPR